MKIEVYAANTHVTKKDLAGKTVVVVDTLRAASTIVTALHNGCAQIIPVEDVESAMNLCSEMRLNNAVLGGERYAKKLPGFDFGNSPLEYVPEAIADKTLILSTSNGTAAIAKATDAKRVYIGAMINASALVEELATLNDDVVILCSGTHGKFSCDDIITAGCFISKLRQKRIPLELDDLARVAERYYDKEKKGIQKALMGSAHFEYLMSLGLKDDIDYCLSLDLSSVVPVLVDGRIVAK